MKARIARALDIACATDLTVATFHGFSFRHLKRNPQMAGLSERFQLWDAPQQRHVFNSRRMWWNEDVNILDIIAGAKERLQDAESFAAGIDPSDEVLVNAVQFFRVYEQALNSAGAIDFSDMVPLVVRAMTRDAAYSEAITGAYDHLLVDEYQDINPGQIELIDRFVQAGGHLWAVGEDDQTLYAFRAADLRYTLDFPHKYRGAHVHVLDRNYRSAARIVAAAKRLIANNHARRHKDYKPVIADAGEIVIRGYSSPEIEARQVARGVVKLLKHHSPRHIAVLYRVGAVGLALQPALQKLQVPYEVRGAGDFWQGVAAKLVVGSLYYLRDGDSVEAMSRMGSGRRADIIRRKLDLAASEARRMMLEQLDHPPRHLPCLDLGGAVAPDDDLARIGNHRLVVFVSPGVIVRDQLLGGCYDPRCRTIVAIQNVNMRAAVLVRKVERIAHVRCPERVERLVIIANRPQVHPRLHEAIDQLDLAGVDVLIFVNEKMVVCARDSLAVGGIPGHGPNHKRHHIGKVDRTGTVESPLVDPEELHRIHQHLVAGINARGEAFRILKALLGAGEDG